MAAATVATTHAIPPTLISTSSEIGFSHSASTASAAAVLLRGHAVGVLGRPAGRHAQDRFAGTVEQHERANGQPADARPRPAGP